MFLKGIVFNSMAICATLFGYIVITVAAAKSDPRFFMQRGPVTTTTTTTTQSPAENMLISRPDEDRGSGMLDLGMVQPIGYRAGESDFFIPRANWFFPGFGYKNRGDDNEEETESGQNGQERNRFENYKRMGSSGTRGTRVDANKQSNKQSKSFGQTGPGTKPIDRLNYSFFRLMGR